MNEKQIEKEVYDFLNGISETSRIYFVGNTLKNPLEYKANEEIVFKMRVKTAEQFVVSAESSLSLIDLNVDRALERSGSRKDLTVPCGNR